MREIRGLGTRDRGPGSLLKDIFRSASFCLFLSALLLLLAACGKKGPLVPPEALVPPAINDLKVMQKGESFEVSWSRPAPKVSGDPAAEVSGFRVMRREVLPSGQDCERCPDAYSLIRNIDLEYLKDTFRRGNLFLFNDTGLTTGTTYQYKAVAVNREGVAGPESNKPRKTKVPPPPAPRLQVAQSGASLFLSWDFKPLPDATLLVGYVVYRQGPAGSFIPMVPRPLADFRFRDDTVAPATAYRYVVRSVATVDDEVVESEPSNEAAGEVLPPGMSDRP